MKYFILFLSLCIFPYDIFADEAPPTTPNIIPRASWGANSEYNNLYSSYWQDILAARAAYVPTSIDLEKQKKNREKQAKINTYLNTHFAQQFQTAQKILFSPNNKKYAWPLKYTDYVDSIVIHHTHSEYADSLTGMRNIHKFHSLSRQWGDIGYNYIIGYDGSIYEGREGGKYSVGAHSVYNNYGTVGIAIMGNYETKGMNTQQSSALKQLVKYLTYQYGIDLQNKRYYHKSCSGDSCDIFPLETHKVQGLVGHRDTSHTHCPGDELYKEIGQLQSELIGYTQGFVPVKRGETPTGKREISADIQMILSVLEKYSDEELGEISEKIKAYTVNKNFSVPKQKLLQKINIAIYHRLSK